MLGEKVQHENIKAYKPTDQLSGNDHVFFCLSVCLYMISPDTTFEVKIGILK